MLLVTLLLAFLLLLALLYLIVRLWLRPRPVTIPIKNRHVFVTGGSIGLGLAIAKQAASEGAARISLLARSLDKLQEAKQSISQAYNVDVSIFAADVRDYDAVQRAVNEAGPIDVLVVNHGISAIQELENQGLDVIKFLIDVNMMGSFNVIKAALPLMKDRKDKDPASIAIMCSMAALGGLYGYAAYSASKFGLRGLAESLQQEVIEDNIHVSLIFPPVIETAGLRYARKTMPEISRIISNPAGLMEAEQVGKASIDGIKTGRFNIPCNFVGELLTIATAGVSPQRSFFMASFQVVAAALFRFGALLHQWNLYRTIAKWHAAQNKYK